jgi:hypothetical protein
MTHYKCLPSLSSIDDPLIYRTMHSFMAFCIFEHMQYADDDPDFEDLILDFALADGEDVGFLESLSDPEEWSLIETHCCNVITRLYRIIYTDQVLFVPEHLSRHISFLP